MSNYRFIEDIFLDFYQAAMSGSILLDQHEDSVASSFYFIILENRQFTAKQAAYLLKILKKHSITSRKIGLDYDAELEDPQWKKEFRIIDNTKSVSVEKDVDNIWLILKLPYALKEKLEKIVDHKSSFRYSQWDSERQVRKISLYSCNIILLNDFFIENNFIRDESFMNVLSTVEEVWQNQESLLHRCRIVDSRVELLNASDSANTWWIENRTSDLYKDLFLAKSIGYYLDLEGNPPRTDVEKICSSYAKSFRFKDIDKFFKFYNYINCRVAVILNKDKDSLSWTREFTKIATKYVKNHEIKICFRLDKNEDQDFNQWIKDQGFGGKIDNGKIFIFLGKPAKWIFTQHHDIDIILSNTLYPIPSSITQDWMASHHCICYTSEYKASHLKDETIVDL